MRTVCPYNGKSIVDCETAELLANPKDDDVVRVYSSDGEMFLGLLPRRLTRAAKSTP